MTPAAFGFLIALAVGVDTAARRLRKVWLAIWQGQR
jgi:hypothetical protein